MKEIIDQRAGQPIPEEEIRRHNAYIKKMKRDIREVENKVYGTRTERAIKSILFYAMFFGVLFLVIEGLNSILNRGASPW